jgi:hypothetical protein
MAALGARRIWNCSGAGGLAVSDEPRHPGSPTHSKAACYHQPLTVEYMRPMGRSVPLHVPDEPRHW